MRTTAPPSAATALAGHEPHRRARVTAGSSQTDVRKMSYPLLALLLVSAGCSSMRTPERPKAVPEMAVWAGGADGGAWIDCSPAAKEPYFQYNCTVYHESGTIWSSGAFIVAERRDGGHDFPAGGFIPPRLRRYQDYDGRRISVSDQRSLVPSGWIDYPFGDGHGRHERYERGEALEGVEY